MDAITKLKSKFQSPSVVGGSRGANSSNSTPSRSRSTSSIPLKRSNPRSNFKDDHDEDLDDDLGAGKEGEDWEVGYQSNKMAKTDSNSNPSTSKINSNSSQRKPSYTSNDLQQNDRSAASPSTALHPKQLPASNPGGSPASGGNGEAYYLCQYRKPQARKHKTWDGDAVLIVSVSGSTCSLKCAETCKDLVTGAKFGQGHLKPEDELSVGGKEIEIEREISKEDYLNVSPLTSAIPILRAKAPIPSRPVSAAFKPPTKVPTTLQINQSRTKSSWIGNKAVIGKSNARSDSLPTVSSHESDGDGEVKIKKEKEKGGGVSTNNFYAKKDFSSKSNPAIFLSPTKPKLGLTNPGMGVTAHSRFPADAPGAVVMVRPDGAHQKLYNRRGYPIVDVVLDPSLSAHLRPHQVTGVKFLYETVMGMRHTDQSYQGCILADEMGLGKTLQTIALCSMLLRQSCYYTPASATIDRVLIVCPLSLVKNWKREFRKWIGNNSINVLAIDSSGQQKIESFVRSKTYQVLIIGYEKLRTCISVLKGVQPPIGLIVCDEGHRLKSKDAKTTKMFDELTTRRRIILSGTPIQNDLSEFYAMIDFVNPGLIGDYPTFKKVFEDPIVKSRMQNSRREVRETGEARTQQLAKITNQIILRRTADLLSAYLLPKLEFVVFCSPTVLQIDIYKHILGSGLMRQVLNGVSSNPLVLIGHLRKLCNSPELLLRTVEEKNKPGAEDSVGKAMLGDVLKAYPKNRVACDPSLSGKMMTLMSILRKTRETTQDKVVVCSNFTATLDIIEGACRKSRYSFVRLDGKTKEADRMDIVNTFNKSSVTSSFVFLLSAKSGGVGLNLIGANRLVLFDSDWNPATDLQVMARIHRDGQKKTCYIYRLLIAGTMDEKIFQRQISKMGLSDSLMDSNAASSKSSDSFSAEELRDIFRLHEDTKCLSHDHLCCSCGGTGKLDDARKSGNRAVREDDNDDESSQEVGFQHASQHNVTQAQKNARDKRAKLVALFDWSHLDCTKPSASDELDDPILQAIVATQAPPRIISTQSQSQVSSPSKGAALLHPNLESDDSLLPGPESGANLNAEMEQRVPEKKRPSLLEQLDQANLHIKKEIIDSDPASTPERNEKETQVGKKPSKKRARNSSSPPIDSDEDEDDKEEDSSSQSDQDLQGTATFNISAMDPGSVLYVYTKSANQLQEAKKNECEKRENVNGKGKGKPESENSDDDSDEEMERRKLLVGGR